MWDAAFAIARLDPGDLAQLRRADPAAPPPVFWRLDAKLSLSTQLAGGEDDRCRLLQLIAILTPTGRDFNKPVPHDGKLPLGRLLHRIGYSEPRLARLMSATPERRRDLLLRLARQLAGVKFDLRPLSDLMIARSDKTREQRALRRLASDYYAAEAAAERQQGKSEDA
jgi:CRISPR type I-E-associated protein CasB/Cse2